MLEKTRHIPSLQPPPGPVRRGARRGDRRRVFGVGVAKRLSPYSAEDPSTQSVQAKNRYQAAAGRQIDPGVIALVRTGGVQTRERERRVRSVEAQLRCEPRRRERVQLLRQPRSGDGLA